MSGYQAARLRTVTPRIITDDVAGLVAFLKAVFNGSGEVDPVRPTEIGIGDSTVMVSDGGGLRPAMAAFLYVYVPDADESYRRAMATGATSIEAPLDTPYGDRRATLQDPWGNLWQIATCQIAG
ncbi:MAG TPA: VOC family protein [Caulobacteraceae bacterium]|nr:VOC family protein [Caulobacteraceae bacterium]